MGAVAKIEEISLPEAADPGELIVGTITLKNVGDEPTGVEAGFLGVLITTLFDGKEHPLFLSSGTKPGETFTFNFRAPRGVGTMPDKDAEMEIVGRIWLGSDIGWRVDDTKSWIVKLLPPSIPLWKIAVVGVSALIAVAATFRIKRRR